MGAFDDLIPAVEDRPQGPPQGHFDDLLPQPVDAKSFFADLIPKPDPGTIGPSTRGPIRRGLSYISRKLEPITPKNRGPSLRTIPTVKDVTKGGPKVAFAEGVASPFEDVEGPISRPLIGGAAIAGRLMGRGGKLLEAAVGDVANIPAAIAGYTPLLENLSAFAKEPWGGEVDENGNWKEVDKPLPIEERANMPGKVGRFAMKAGLGAARMEPQLAAGFGLGALGLPSSVAAGLPMLATPQGEIDPIGAVIAAGLPGVARLGESAVAKILSKIPVSQILVEIINRDPLKLKGKVIQQLGGFEISNDQFRKFLEAGGGFVAANAYLLATQAPALATLTPAQRQESILDTIAANIAPSLLGFVRQGMSHTLEGMAPDVMRQMNEAFRQDKNPFVEPTKIGGPNANTQQSNLTKLAENETVRDETRQPNQFQAGSETQSGVAPKAVRNDEVEGGRRSIGPTVETSVTQPEAEAAVRSLMGDVPENVRFINDPTAPRGEIVMIPGRRGEIELNLAKLGSSGSVKDTVLEELVHGVQNNRANNTPEVNSALDAIDSLVTEVDRQRKAEEGYNPDETQEEAANERARRIFEDADKANIFVRAWRAIVKAFKDLFGIKLSEAENARSAAKAIITEALKNKPTAGIGRRGAEPTAAELRKQRRERAIETGVEEKWIPTQVGGTTDYVRGREQITPLSTSESLVHARNIFNEAGIEVTRDQDAGGWRIVDRGYDQSAAGRLLADILKREIRNKNEPGKAGDLLASLLNSVVYNFKAGSMANFDTPTRQELYSIAQSDRSARGLALGALAGFGEDLQFVAQNVDVVLNRIWSDRYGGEALTHLLDRVVNNFRGYFTDAEIAAALKENRDAEQFISRLIALNRKDEGGRVYRRVQALLKPKQAKTLAKLEADARIEEAVNEILAQASRQGIEPRPTPGKPLPALHKLLLLVSDKNAAAIDRLIANAVSNAERNAGIAAQLKAATSPEELEEWQQRFADGEDPSAEMVEEGLDFPQFSHWRDIRDNLLDYSPITLKLVQDVVRGSFKGTVRGKPVQKQDVRLDLNLLAKSPEQAVAKALDEYLTIVQANMDLEGATPETQARIEAMLRQEVESQLEAARKRFRSKMFTAPLKPGEKLSDEQRMAQLLNAGLFRDENLNIPEMVERAARKSQFQRLNPSVAELIKQVFATPFYRQQDLATEFAAQMVRRFGVPEDQAAKAAELFSKAFEKRFAVAREKAAKAARETITPQEMQAIGMKKSVWRRIEQAVNSGLFDTGSVLREIAAEHHWKAPTDDQVARMKRWSEEEQRLRELTPEQRAAVGTDPAKLELARLEKEKVFEERRTALKKKIEAEWARITRPLALPGMSLESYAAMWEHRKNNAAALNELASANILLKAGFIPRQIISVLLQGAIHTPTRAIAHALINHIQGNVKGSNTKLLDDIQIALRDSYKVRLASLHSALYATRAAFLGRGEARNVDRLMSSIGAIERIVRKADEAAEAGRPGEAMMYRLMSLIRLGYRVAQAFDNIHGLPAEYQEMVLQVENGLRQLGMDRAQIEANKHRVFGTMQADWARAIDQARMWFESEGVKPTATELHESAWILVKAWQYERIRDLGLPADDFQERNRLLRSTVGWNERETRGLGGLVGGTIGGISQAGESMGIPLMVGRFGNAIAISINRALSFTPFASLSNAFGPGTSAWHATEADRLQRKMEMAGGSIAGLVALLAVLAGAVVVRLSMPRDPEERALWEKQGIRPNTVEFHLGNGSFIPFSLNTGPMAPLAPYFAAGGALHDLAVSRQKAQEKLNAEAAKRGVTPGKINPISIGDQLAVAAAAAQGVIMGGRTAAGLLTSLTDYGVPNSQKLVASQLSPLVPGLPALQEVSRMAGVTLDAKMATVWDFMLPLPTSAARKVNLLGDPAGTPNDLQRIIQVLTAGTYPGIVTPAEATESAAYATLYESGYRPPSIDPNRGYSIGGEYRPLTPAELAQYTVKRGQYLKSELIQAGQTADPKVAAAAYQRANERALAEVGVEKTKPAAPAPPLAMARSPRGYRGASLRRRRPALKFSKGPSLRLRRSGLRLPSTRVRIGRGGSLRRPRLSALR